MPPKDPASDSPSGLPHAIGAYLVWGLLPLYLRLVHSVPPFEFVGWRLIFTLPVCLAIVALRRQGAEVLAALGNPRTLGLLLLSALLIGANWLLYITAIQEGHVFATSLGYYINPLMNVLAGTLFLGEKLNRRQWTAVAIAAAGVSLLAWDAREMLGIALALAITFSGYGLARRFAPVGSLPGLTIETILLLVPAIGIVVWQTQDHGTAFGRDMRTDLLLPLSGVLTAIPLLMFATATRRMNYSTLGFIQYLSPTIVFLLGLFVFHEPLRPVQLVCFLLIWTAAAVFVWDLLSRRRASGQAPA
ncbi:EamA family transporter RarD [Novosphingobium sp. PS1R-30]|uniref:EamA family transporter RarD n=1 Tax=Novosphingobium anseongense TaxID=3133436 RepID=A0ABU8S0W1_9SPHN|nr:MAG: EamA family transporter RarD [Novosphingobium sp.]